MIRYLLFYLTIINIITFIVYASDKKRAKRHSWRIPEATLITLAAAGGSIGALLGMYLLRHKTRHAKFYIGVPIILLLQLAAYGKIFWDGGF